MALPMVNTARYSVFLPGCGKDVEYRPFFVKEQKVIMQAAESEDPAQISTATADMIKACTFEKLEVDDLTSSDVEYLLLKIRTKSVGENAKVTLKCQSCDHPIEHQINLDAIEPTGSETGEVKVQVNDSIGVCFRMPTIGKLRKFMTTAGGRAEDTVLATIAAAVDYVYDADQVYPSSDQTPEEIIQFMESLNAEQFGKVQTSFDEFPRLVHEVEYKCDQCGNDNKITLGGIGDFLN